MKKPYETFDVDLRDGKAREDAFAHVMLRSQVEHKRDKKAALTGNIAVELCQRWSDGTAEPSGIQITTAERYAIEFYPECWLILPTEFVKALADKARVEGLTDWIGDGQNHYNALIPIEWFVRPTILKAKREAA